MAVAATSDTAVSPASESKNLAEDRSARISSLSTKDSLTSSAPDTPKTCSAKASRKTERPCKAIRCVDDVVALYDIGSEVKPCLHQGMKVLHATEKCTGAPVVLKVRSKETSFGSSAKQMRWRENAEFMLNFRHAAFAQIYEILEDSESYYVIMELVKGHDLFDSVVEKDEGLFAAVNAYVYNVLAGDAPLEVADYKEIIRQLLVAVCALHKRGHLHRDLKLDNVMLDRSPATGMKVKLIDFDTVSEADTKVNRVVGTDQYIAPEAYEGNYSEASDIFAVGVIAYRLLTGRFPFSYTIFNDGAGENVVGSKKMKEIKGKLCSAQVDYSHDVFKSFPKGCKLVKSMLSVKDSQRPSASDALDNAWFSTKELASILA
jgi:serine/threonine protein kinase